MNYPAHDDHGQASDPYADHKRADMQGGHNRHAGHSVAMFRDKFWLSFALTIPVVVWSSDVQQWFGYTAPSFPGSKLVLAVLGTGVFMYGGLVFIRGARRELADHKPGMMTPISLGVIVAFGTSVAATLSLFETDVWWELATLIAIMVLGHWLEMRAIPQARGALNALAALLPDTVERVTGADTQSIPLSELRPDACALRCRYSARSSEERSTAQALRETHAIVYFACAPAASCPAMQVSLYD